MEDLLRGAAPMERHLKKHSTLTKPHPSPFDDDYLEDGASFENTGWYLCNTGPLDRDESCSGVEKISELDANARAQLNASGKEYERGCTGYVILRNYLDLQKPH